MPHLLSLCAAFCYGAGDFLGGLAARRASPFATAFVVLLTGLAVQLPWVPWQLDGAPPARTLVYGAVAGVAGSIAGLTLYPALAFGSASEVAPLSAVIGTALPIVFGLALGERPSASAWAGIALAVLTIVLVSSDGRRRGGSTDADGPARRRRSLLLAAVSGVFIGVFMIAFERAGADQGFLPLFVARATAVPLFALVLLVRRERPWPRGGSLLPAVAAGTIDVCANGCYLFALAGAPLSIVATLSNLYPAFTVLLGVAFLRDRPRPGQQLGLALALLAIFLITR